METRLTSRGREVVISGDRPFVIIGERINPTGRKVLAAEMKDGVMDRVRSDAQAQTAAGAHMLDVNAGIPAIDEPALLVAAIKAVMEVTDIPICIDSSIIEALEAGLSAYEGKALVNSVTAEEDRMERILPLVKKHGAAVIGMANDETGITMVPEERLALARRIVERAADHGIPQEDVIIDPIAMTVAADPTCGLITLETMRLIRDKLGNNMTCGASNVSFGLPDRPAVNAAFLPLAMHAGLTCAITNPLEAQVRRAILAGDLLLGHDEYAMRWISNFRADQAAKASAK
ncbi:MAG: methyltetrahydrofolate cobalamin methyltransferase [Chloroflexi bacterium]|nr:MAG: methyltetrahydrofolate--corrinoid methyltransferase [Actinobacteria bacterium 13_2_20CM_2_66_6]TMD40789.1 MAG: methyltetrahydrofolate cobalamin methyltransferase [Chloroflexota bacterium]TMD73900.1 MAG: methyltetrahydrofolate cobalamin methyltransferase [Chloroflexota bacterium]